MTIVTFTKLLVIKIVASRRSLSSSKLSTRLFTSVSTSSSWLISDGESEKKAISEAEANADSKRSRAAKTIATIAPTDGEEIVISLNMEIS